MFLSLKFSKLRNYVFFKSSAMIYIDTFEIMKNMFTMEQ